MTPLTGEEDSAYSQGYSTLEETYVIDMSSYQNQVKFLAGHWDDRGVQEHLQGIGMCTRDEEVLVAQRGCVPHHLFDVIAEDGTVMGPLRTRASHSGQLSAQIAVKQMQPLLLKRIPPPPAQRCSNSIPPPPPFSRPASIILEALEPGVAASREATLQSLTLTMPSLERHPTETQSPNLVDSMGQLSVPPGLQLIPPVLPLLGSPPVQDVPKSSGVGKAVGSTSVGFWQH